MTKSKFVERTKRKAMSLKLHPKTNKLLELLHSHTGETKTDFLESALWEAFATGRLTDKKTLADIKREIEREYPGTFQTSSKIKQD